MSYRVSKSVRTILRLWRSARYRLRFNKCGPDFYAMGKLVIVNEGTLIAGRELTIRSVAYRPVEIRVNRKARLIIGDNVFLNMGVRIGCSAEIVIGDSCLIGDEVLIFDSDWHGVGDSPTRTQPVRIDTQVWIPARAIILRDVTLGAGCVLSPASVVIPSLDPFPTASC